MKPMKPHVQLYRIIHLRLHKYLVVTKDETHYWTSDLKRATKIDKDQSVIITRLMSQKWIYSYSSWGFEEV